jgi:hypothetical protein
MDGKIRNIIKEEFDSIMSKTYSANELKDAILNKYFVHTKSGHVYSPVRLEKDGILGVDSDCQHVNISIEEITMIESSEERFGN